MNISLATKIPSLRARTTKVWLLGALALGASSFAMANETAQQPASNTYQLALQAKVLSNKDQGEAGNRVDWNGDYPSQLAPQKVPVTNGTPASKVAPTVDTTSSEQL